MIDSKYVFKGPNSKFNESEFIADFMPENTKCKFLFWNDAANLTLDDHYKIEQLYTIWYPPTVSKIESWDYLIIYHSYESLDCEVLVTLYKMIDDMKLPYEKIILIFGDIAAEKTHDDFCVRNSIVNRINVIGACMFEFQIRYDFSIDYFNEYYPIIRDSILNKKSRKSRFFSLSCKVKDSRTKLIKMFDGVKGIDISDLSKGKFLDPWNFKIFTTIDGVTKTIDELYSEFKDNTAGYTPDVNKYQYFADNMIWQPDQERLYKLYLEYYMEIVCESNTENDSDLFLSEKICKPLYFGQPFGILGNRFTLEYLRTLGYETFPEIFDESYDTHLKWIHRFKSLTLQIKTLLALSDKDFENIIYSVGDKSLHNIHNFFEGDIGMKILKNKLNNIIKPNIKSSPSEEFNLSGVIKNFQN